MMMTNMLTDKHLKKLNKDGYCIINNVLTDNECNQTITEVWDWLEGLETGIDRADSDTWKNDKWPHDNHGIIQHFRIGHAQFIWNLRQNKKIIDIFATLWNTKELLVSFDAMSIMRPTYTKSTGWFHTDQSPMKKGLHCVQGFINLEDTSESDGSLVVLKGSHKLHEKLFAEFHPNKSMPSDWYKFTPDELQWYEEQGCVEHKLVIPKGAFVLWDSRTVHCNAPHHPDHDPSTFRYAVYICMTPVDKANDKIIERKRNAFYNLRMTNHWPHQAKLFPEKPYTYSKPLPDYKLQTKLPKLSKRGKRLAGVIGYDNDMDIVEV